MSETYIRYVTRGRHGRSMEKTGLFASAYKLRDEGSLPAPEQRALQLHLLWFQRHVRPAGIDELSEMEQQAVCWYRPLAHEALARTRELAVLLQQLGFTIGVERTDRPGVIIYRDEVQVAAVPIRNTVHGIYLRMLVWRQRTIPSINL